MVICDKDPKHAHASTPNNSACTDAISPEAALY